MGLSCISGIGVHIMKCYVDFFIRYCPYCGKRIEIEQESEGVPHQDYLQGKTIICSCGVKCQYLPEHKFPYIEDSDSSAIV